MLTDERIDIICPCGTSFCSKCGKEDHYPVTCEQLASWESVNGSSVEEETDLWIKINTKQCPKCHVQIEKNSGCMHMTCKKCKYEFCWLCMGSYRNHKKEMGTDLCSNVT